MYSNKPKRLPAVVEINHDKEIAVATSGLIPIRPKNSTKAPSLIPRPEIDIGRVANRIMSGKKIRHARNGICCPMPSARIYTAKIPENCINTDKKTAFPIISF